MKVGHGVIAPAILLLGLSGCSTLAPQVQKVAVDFSSVYEEFGNQVLLANVLRARDKSPLSFSELPTISGALSMKTTAGLSLPFGPLQGSDARKTFTPGVEFSSSPTFDTQSINNQAFTLSLLQPVSPAYIQSLWDAGFSRSLLMLVFAESIELPNGNAKRILRNDPDANDRFEAFKRFVVSSTAQEPSMRSFTLIDPIGPPVAVAPPASAPVSGFAAIDLDKFIPLAQLDPKQFRIEVVKEDKRSGLQIYRRYPGLSMLCVDFRKALVESGVIMVPGADGGLSMSTANGLASDSTRLLSIARGSLHSSTDTKPTMDNSRRPGNGLSLTAATGLVGSASTSVLLEPGHCPQADVVVSPGTQSLPTDLGEVGYVHWRSPVNVFRFLGAMLRGDVSNAWEEKAGKGSTQVKHIIFAVKDAPGPTAPEAARIAVRYADKLFYIPQPMGSSPTLRDHSLEVLSLVSQLVNTSKHAEDLPTPRTLQVLP